MTDPRERGKQRTGTGHDTGVNACVSWATQVFTVSVLIFVGLDIHGTMVRLARILEARTSAEAWPPPVPNVIMHGPAARSLTIAALGGRRSKNKNHARGP